MTDSIKLHRINTKQINKRDSMKKILISVLGLFILGVIYLAIKGNDMQEIRTEIDIAAPPEKVWDILMDFNKWQEWSPIVRKSSGTAALGNALQFTMVGKTEGEDGPTYSPIIEEMNKPSLFRWRANMMAGFIMTNDKVFELEATPTGTKLIHKELFKGLLAPVFCTQMEKGVPPMLNSMNKALKELAEK